MFNQVLKRGFSTLSKATTYRVVRIDTNGNRFIMQKRLPREEADKIVEDFEARPHKQGYFAEKESPSHDVDDTPVATFSHRR